MTDPHHHVLTELEQLEYSSLYYLTFVFKKVANKQNQKRNKTYK